LHSPLCTPAIYTDTPLGVLGTGQAPGIDHDETPIPQARLDRRQVLGAIRD
jgi:hypothetical protein